METEVYSYKEASRFLKDQWLIRKDKNPALSVRSWAKHLGFKSHSMLQHFLDGDKKIPKKYIPVFIKHLKLSTREGLYFETMVDLQRAKSLEEKMIYLERLNELLPAQPIKIHEVEAYKSIRDPLHNLIFEMVNLVDFKYDLKWIQQRIYFETSVESILLSSVPLAQNASAGVSGLGNGSDVRVCFKSTDTYETVLERISANRDGVNLPSNCMLIQIAVQNDVGVVYDERLYARLNDLEKAGLILHETAFFLGRIHDKTITALNDRDRRSTALDHADSTRIREFTVRVFSQDIEELSSLEMFEWFVDDVRLAVNGIALSSYSFVDILGAAKIVNPGAEVLIDSEGNLLGIKQKFIYENLTFTSGNFFEGNGRLASGNLERSTVIQSVPVGGGKVFFHGNGRLYRGSLSQEHTFAKRRGTKTLRNGDQFWLDEEGYLTNR